MATGKKTGGRKKGTPNKGTAAIRERIESKADPVGFMISVMTGKEMDGTDDNGKAIKIKPALSQRLHAAQWLGDKIAPSLKAVEISGKDGLPIELLTINHTMTPEEAAKAYAAEVAETE